MITDDKCSHPQSAAAPGSSPAAPTPSWCTAAPQAKAHFQRSLALFLLQSSSAWNGMQQQQQQQQMMQQMMQEEDCDRRSTTITIAAITATTAIIFIIIIIIRCGLTGVSGCRPAPKHRRPDLNRPRLSTRPRVYRTCGGVWGLRWEGGEGEGKERDEKMVAERREDGSRERREMVAER